jgi:hypothetical protein
MNEKNIVVGADVGDIVDELKEGVGEVKALETIEEKYANVTLRLIEKYGPTLTPLTLEGEKTLDRKLYIHVMLLVCDINLVLFVSDGSILSESIEKMS